MDYHRKMIPINDLLLDTENARHGVQDDQSAVLNWMVSSKDRAKVMTLARSIAKQGPSPSELPIVVPAGRGEQKLYVVVEGNRRTAVLKMLLDPEKCPDVSARKQFHKLRQEAQVTLPSALECVVYPNLKSAAPWIELRHLGEQGGAGTVGWGAKESEYFAARIGQPGRYEAGMQLLNYATQMGLISNEESDRIPITNLMRLINSPTVRRALGLNLTQGKLSQVADEAYVDRAVSGMLKELSIPKKWTVSHLKSTAQREKFINQVKEEQEWGPYLVQKEMPLVARVREGGDREANEGPPPNAGQSNDEKAKRTSRDSLARKTAISSSASMSIENKRLRSIFRELKKIDVEEFPNAAAVLTRVFIEGCVDLYAEKNGIMFNGKSSLVEKARRVKEHILQTNGTRQQQVRNDLKGLETFCGDPESLGSSNTFNSVVHNMKFALTPDELKRNWDRLEPCLPWFDRHV